MTLPARKERPEQRTPRRPKAKKVNRSRVKDYLRSSTDPNAVDEWTDDLTHG